MSQSTALALLGWTIMLVVFLIGAVLADFLGGNPWIGGLIAECILLGWIAVKK